MALTYRSPIEEVLNRFTSEEQSRVSSTSVSRLTQFEVNNHKLFSFAMSEKAKEKLIKVGIYLSPFSFEPHSHPVCKTLENHILYNVLVNKLDNSFYAIGIKGSKVNFLKSRSKNLSMLEYMNRIVTSADKYRYGSDFTTLSTQQIDNLCSKQSLEKCGTLRELVPLVKMSKKKRNFFLHDELHYWSSHDLMLFLDSINPDHLLATVVFPPEILAGAQESLNPWCYSFQRHGSKLTFFPDGVQSESYTQPLSAGYILQASKIICPSGQIYSVDLVYSAFAHHIISITKGDLPGLERRFFSNFEATGVKHLSGLSYSVRDCIPVSSDLISKLYRYIRTLKKPDLQSCMAKLSQIVPNPTGTEIKFTEDFARLTMDVQPMRSMLMPETAKLIGSLFASFLPFKMARFFDCYKTSSLDKFIHDLEPFSFSVETKVISSKSSPMFEAVTLGETMSSEEVLKILAKLDMGAPMSLEGLTGKFKYSSEAYHGLHHVLDGCGPHVFRRLVRKVADSFCNEFGIYRKSSYVSSVAITVLQRKTNSNLSFIFGTDLNPMIIGFVRNYFASRRSSLLIWFHDRPESWFQFSRLRANQKFLRSPIWSSELDLAEFRVRKNLALEILGFNKGSNLRKLGSFQTAPTNTKSQTSIPEGASSHQGSQGGQCNEAKLQINFQRELEFCMGSLPEAESFKSLASCVEEIVETGDEVIPSRAGPGKDGLVFGCIPAASTPAFTFSSANQEDRLFSSVVEENVVDVGILPPMELVLPSDAEATPLNGRQCYFFTRCGCIDYGHNKIRYKPNKWFSGLDSILKDESTYYNACLLQVYEAGAGIGFHSDNEKVYHRSPIKTINFCGEADFVVKAKGRRGVGVNATCHMRTGQFFTMDSNFQSYYQHSVQNCSEGRVSLTFRYHVNSIAGLPIKHTCGEFGDTESLFDVLIRRSFSYSSRNFHTFPVPGDGDCFWHSLGALLGVDGEELKKISAREISKNEMLSRNSSLSMQMESKQYAERESIAAFCKIQSVHLVVLLPDQNFSYEFLPMQNAEVTQLFVQLSGEHFEPALPINGCVVKSIAETLNQTEAKILSVIGRPNNRLILEGLVEGEGLNIEDLEAAFSVFGICARVSTEKGVFTLNKEGNLYANYELKSGHIMYLKKNSSSQFAPTNPIQNFNCQGPEIFLRGIVSEVDYKPSWERARNLEESLLNGTTGILCDKIINLQKNWLTEDRKLNDGSRSLGVVLGTFGSGKSSLFKRFIVKNPSRSIIFVSPRRSLANQIKEDLGLNTKRGKSLRVRVLTLESFIKAVFSFKAASVVLDEVQLYPPGYLDLVMLCLSLNCQIYLAGDPCQSDYDSAKDRALFDGLRGDIFEVLSEKRYKFNISSRRFQSEMFVGRLPCRMDTKAMTENESFHWLESIESAAEVSNTEYDVVLVSSFEEKKIVWAHLGRDLDVLTFGESTGLTFNRGIILISHESTLTSERRWITALSRFRLNIIFVNLVGNSVEDVCQVFHDRTLDRFLTKRATIANIVDQLPGLPELTNDFGDKIGRSEGVMEAKLSGDPWLKTEIDLLQDEDQEMEELAEEVRHEPWFKTHLPLFELESIRASWVHRIMNREYREVRCGSEVTTQFPDDHPNGAKMTLANAAERFEAIYPRHRGSDSVTFLMAVKKRLSFSQPSKESAKLSRAKPYGKFLVGEFLKRIPLRGDLDPILFARAKRDFEEKKTSKSAAVIENHSGRSCRDWLADVGFIFMKSQFCSKWDNRFRDAKAGQTLACFHHSILCRFAPYMRYIEYKLQAVLPSNLYIHSGKNLEDLNEWVIRNKFSGMSTESDYEAFDSSQDHFILSFEIEIMKHLQLPWDLIEDYVYIKTHLGSKLGNFAIMRFTGEASTFLFNTMANMLFTFLRYDLNGSEAICFAGDDMCANRRLRVSKRNENFLGKIKLKAKVQFTEKPTFCGWNLCMDGIFKRPQLVLERLCVAREKDNLANCLDSYAIEVGYAFALGERILQYMDEEALQNHYSCVRFIIKHSHLLKSSVRDLFLGSM
uniref:Replicase n=1 Tax=Asian prunus virus 1 TaxID=351427 RepID=A0A240G1D1_9VIRU|nr:replicase [Asian prunus virus 1]